MNFFASFKIFVNKNAIKYTFPQNWEFFLEWGMFWGISPIFLGILEKIFWPHCQTQCMTQFDAWLKVIANHPSFQLLLLPMSHVMIYARTSGNLLQYPALSPPFLMALLGLWLYFLFHSASCRSRRGPYPLRTIERGKIGELGRTVGQQSRVCLVF